MCIEQRLHLDIVAHADCGKDCWSVHCEFGRLQVVRQGLYDGIVGKASFDGANKHGSGIVEVFAADNAAIAADS